VSWWAAYLDIYRNDIVVVNLFHDGELTYGVHNPLYAARGFRGSQRWMKINSIYISTGSSQKNDTMGCLTSGSNCIIVAGRR
jgi:hypothetical protein